MAEFLGGLGVGFATGFLTKAGEDAWTSVLSRVRNRLWPPPPQPVEVDGTFVPTQYPPGSCGWVPELAVYEAEQRRLTYYPHPESGSKCYRMVPHGSRLVKEFLMVQPGTEKIGKRE